TTTTTTGTPTTTGTGTPTTTGTGTPTTTTTTTTSVPTTGTTTGKDSRPVWASAIYTPTIVLFIFWGESLKEAHLECSIKASFYSSSLDTCSDLAGYFEEGTGHTCETYIDYGFCNGTSVVATSGIDSEAAQQNCCACGNYL
ncbi:unnamed protein product, partial [Rotaria socialis]